MNLGIIIQARIGSTRLPSKIVYQIDEDITFLDLLLSRLILLKEEIPIVLASSLNPKDDILEKYTRCYKINFFRGSEDNVSKRFVDAASKFNIDTIIRVCSDNPFIDLNEIKKLINLYDKQDYLSYKINGKPSILTHYGFFTEIVKLDAIKQIVNKDSCKEHVTNCIYKQPEKFNVSFIEKKIPEKRIRCTLDTMNDLQNLKYFYTNHFKFFKDKINFGYHEIIEQIIKDEDLLKKMEKEIKNNEK